jgi:hypothetical protein
MRLTEIEGKKIIPGGNAGVEAAPTVLEALSRSGIRREHQIGLAHLHTLPPINESRGCCSLCKMNCKLV